MKLTNKFALPDLVVDALRYDDYDAGYTTSRSITQLTDSPQVQILRKEKDDEIEQDVSDLIWSRFGTAGHKMFEPATKSDKYISEERLYFKRSGWNISGKPDYQKLTPEGIECSDLKFTSAWSVVFGPKIEWFNQLNGYAWLIRHAKNVNVTSLQIIAILRDFDRRKAGTSNYPDSPITIVDMPLWSHDKQDEYMDGRIKIHQGAELERLKSNPLPLCSAEERWAKPTTYAVKGLTADGKPKKCALRVFESMVEAQAYVDSNDAAYVVEERPGESTRCVQNWCLVNQFCSQFKSMAEKNDDHI